MFQTGKLHEIVSKYSCELRIKVRGVPTPSSWSTWISEPAANYIETFSSGPWPSRDVEWIDINPIALIHIGKLIKDRKKDNTEAIKQELSSLEIYFQLVDNLIRVNLNES